MIAYFSQTEAFARGYKDADSHLSLIWISQQKLWKLHKITFSVWTQPILFRPRDNNVAWTRDNNDQQDLNMSQAQEFYTLIHQWLNIQLSHSKCSSSFFHFRCFWCQLESKNCSEASLEIPTPSCKDCCCIRGLYAQCSVSVLQHGRCVLVKVCQFGECLV